MAHRRDGRDRPWREDPAILARVLEVEPLHLRHWTIRAIAAQIGCSSTTVARDLDRMRELWLERASAKSEDTRAQIVAELDDTIKLAEDAYAWDKEAEAAVLYGDVTEGQDHRMRIVQRDAKGAAQFRGQKAQALNVRRQAIMDKAKVLGVIVDKVAPTDADGTTLSFVDLARALHAGQQDSTD